MEHKEAALLLPDLIWRRLENRVHAEVMDHVADCEECKELKQSYDVLSEAMLHDEALRSAGHLSSEETAAFGSRTEKIEGAELIRIAAHLRGCAACAGDVEAVRQAHLVTAGGPAEEPAGLRRFGLATFFYPKMSAALAGGITLAVVAVAGFVAYRRLPQLQGQIEALRSEQTRLETRVRELSGSLERATEDLRRASRWSGAVGYLYLTGGARGEQRAASMTLKAGQPFAFIALRPDLPASSLPSEVVFSFAIRAEGERTVWQTDLAGGELAGYLSAMDAVLFQIPAAQIPPGRYTLTMTRRDDASGKPILTSRFEVVTP